MHLTVRVPNTWYRASLEWQDGPNATPHRLMGVTLPGVPAVVVGSNTHVAWGFTNSQGDWSDIVLLEIDPSNSNRYRTPEGWRTFDRYDEMIEVAGEENATAVNAMDDLGAGDGPGSQGTPACPPLGRTRCRPPRPLGYRARVGADDRRGL